MSWVEDFLNSKEGQLQLLHAIEGITIYNGVSLPGIAIERTVEMYYRNQVKPVKTSADFITRNDFDKEIDTALQQDDCEVDVSQWESEHRIKVTRSKPGADKKFVAEYRLVEITADGNVLYK